MNYEDLDQKVKTQLITVGYDLLKVVAEAFGPAKAETCWNQIADSISPDLKYDLIMQMLSGYQGNTVTLKYIGANFISAIKTVRTYTDLGLKDAKLLCDDVRAGKPTAIKLINSALRRECIKEFERCGCDAV